LPLSDAAVALLRFEVKGWRPKDRVRRLAAYRELAEAGIMEPDGNGDYRFTARGFEHREAILERETERIERERYEPPDGDLSDAARERLRHHLAGDDTVTEDNRPAYRELVAARVMIPVHTFVGGREAEYRFTYWGWRLRFELAGVTAPSPSESSSPRR
jgi:hypothetical protein